MSQLRQQEDELRRLDTNVVVVTFEAGPIARAYVRKANLTWPLLIDETRELYRAYGMLTSPFWDLWGPATWWSYAKEMLRGRLPRRATGDVRQRGGDVLIDPTGIVRIHHVGKGPADRPTVSRIQAVIRSAKGLE